MTRYFFFGDECPHCEEMHPLVDALVKEGVTVDYREVWHNEENLHLQESFDKDLCGGVPFLYNTDTKKFICGEASLEELREWAK